MEIYILEDNLIQQGRLEMVLSQELKKYNKDLSIVHTFDKPQQFIEAIDSTTSNQLFFLDIEIKGEKLKGLILLKSLGKKIPTLLLSLSLPTQSLCH